MFRRYIAVDRVKKTDRNGCASILPVPTIGPVGKFQTGDCTSNASTSFQFLWGDRQNRPQEKHREDDGYI